MADAAVATPPAQPDIGALAQQTVSGFEKQQADVAARQEAETAPVREAANTAAEALAKQAAEPVKAQPLPENLAKHLDPRQLNEAASVWMTLGALGGLLMRQPMTAALGNMTAAMKGVQEGDAEQYDKATAEFKQNLDLAMKKNAEMLKEKETALKDTHLSLTARMEQLRLIDVKYGNETGRNAATFKAQMELLNAQQKAQQHADDARQRWEMHAQTIQVERDRMAQASEHFKALHGNGMGQAATDWEDLIEGIAAGRINPNVVSTRGDQRAQIMQEVAKRYPDYDMKTFVSATAAERAFTVGKQADAVRSFGVSDAHLKTLDELGTALKNSDLKAFNHIGNLVAAQTGQPAPTNFDAAKRIVADEIVKAVTGAAGALGDRETADRSLSEANSPEQLKGVIATYRKLIGGQIDGLRRQYEAGTRKKDFDQRFQIGGAKPQPTDKDREYAKRSPELKAAFKAHFGVDP